MKRHPSASIALAFYLFLTASPAAADDLRPGDEVEVTRSTRLWGEHSAGRGPRVRAGDRMRIVEIRDEAARVESLEGETRGWIKTENLRLVRAAPASEAPPPTPPITETQLDPIDDYDDSSPVPSGSDSEPTPTRPTGPPLVAGPAIRVAVYEFRHKDVPERVAEVATNSLVAELRKIERIVAIGIDEIRDMLTHEENKRMLGCKEESCLAEVAGALGVDELVTGTLSQIGGSSVIMIRRLRLRTAETAGSVNRRLTTGDGEEFLAAIGPAIEQLYPEYAPRPGAERGVPKEVALALNPPPLPTWAFWLTAGAAAGVGLLGGGATLISKSKYDQYNHDIRTSQPPGSLVDASLLRRERDEAEAWDQAKLGLLISAGVLALAAGLEALFTDWHGYGDAEIGLSLVPGAGAPASGAAVIGKVTGW